MLFSANDAYVRDFKIILPPDCTVSESAQNNRQVLALTERVLKADLIQADAMEFADGKARVEMAAGSGSV